MHKLDSCGAQNLKKYEFLVSTCKITFQFYVGRIRAQSDGTSLVQKRYLME